MRRLAEAILDIPHLTVEDRAEGKAVIQDLDAIVGRWVLRLGVRRPFGYSLCESATSSRDRTLSV
jgi:hypothetical protein